MNRHSSSRRWVAFLAMAATLLVAGCAQDMGLIDRVQPDAIKKDLLKGEWYFRQTVVDAPVTSAYTFEGSMGTMERGVFEIQESTLYFYRTYEFADDAEAIGFRSDKDTPLCVPVADGEGIGALSDRDLAWCNPGLSPAKKADPSLMTGSETDNLRKLKTRTVEVCGALREVPVIVYRGAPVATWPIEGHFDILYEYNATTGEKTNVRSENTSDRYWADQDFMRVDWSAAETPLSIGYGGKSTLCFNVGGVRQCVQFVAFSVYEGDSAPEGEGIRFEDTAGSPTDTPANIAYMDYLSDHVLAAPTAYLPGFGTIPYCWFYPWYTGGIFECTSERIRVRNSFARVDKIHEGQPSDYVSLDYDDRHMSRFGYFRTERLNWDCEFGSTYSGAVRKANRHRIWDRYVLGSDGKLDYGQMKPTPIVYYLSKGYPRDLVGVSMQLRSDWSKSFDEVVEVRKGSRPDFPMFILCENSDAEAKAASDKGLATACWSGSPEAWCTSFCERMDRPHENGDLRYNYLHAVTTPLQAGLYGFGPSSSDPVSGEIISAAAYAYVAPMKLGARTAVDIIELQAGVKDWREVEAADDRVRENQAGRLATNGEPPTTYFSLERARAEARALIDPDVAERLKTVGPSRTDQDFAANQMARLKAAPELESLLGGDYVRLMQKDPRVGSGAQLGPGEREKYSLGSFKYNGGWRQQMNYYREMSERTLYLADFVDGAILGLAREMGQRYDKAVCSALSGLADSAVDMGQFNEGNPCTTRKVVDALAIELRRVEQDNPNAIYLPKAIWWPTHDDRLHRTQVAIRTAVEEIREQVRLQVWQNIYYGVSLHEVGHTLGLRHNFEGSTDALNYFPSYWQLRGQTVDQTWEPIGGPFGDETLAQQEAKMRQLQSASIMDYGAKFNSDWEGVGYYDGAAIKYAYGQVVETFKQPADLSSVAAYLQDPSDTDPINQAFFLRNPDPMNEALHRVHYTNIPRLFAGDPQRIGDRQNVGLESLKGAACDLGKPGACGGSEYCRHFFDGNFCVTAGVEVPFRFCSDEQSGFTPTCDVWDEGADPYEIVRNTFRDYEEYWPIWGFQRDNAVWSGERYAGRVYRTFKLGQRQFQYWVAQYVRNNKYDWWQSVHGLPYEEDVNGGLPGVLAASISFNTIAKAIGRPITGWYGFHTGNKRYEPWSQIDRNFFDSTTFVFVGEESGSRKMYPSYEFGGTGVVVRSSGAIYDRLNAFEVLADPSFYLLANSENEQIRRYLISYYTAFPRQVTEIFGSVMADDHSRFGWCINPDTDAVRHRVFVGADAAGCTAGTEEALFPEPKYTFPTTKFRIPGLAALYGMSLLTEDYDFHFLDMTHIFLRGHEDAVTPSAGAEVVSFEDPLSGKIYEAIRMGDGTVYDPAFEIIKQAKESFVDFANEDYFLSLQQYLVGKLELFRGMNRLYSPY